MVTIYNPLYFLKTICIASIWVVSLTFVSILKYSNFDVDIVIDFPIFKAFLDEKAYVWITAIFVIDAMISDLCNSNQKMHSSLWWLLFLIGIAIFISKFSIHWLLWVWILLFLTIKTIILLKQNCVNRD